MPISKLVKWKVLLNEFDIVCKTHKVIKGQTLIDHLVENPVDEEYKKLLTYFQNEDVLFI